MQVPWTQPVLLVGRSGQLKLVDTTEKAYRCLTRDWPVSEGPAFFAALEICGKVADGILNSQLSHFAFTQAAMEAGLIVKHAGAEETLDARSLLSKEETERPMEEDR